MKYALLIYENPNALAERNEPERSAYIGAWRAYYRALGEAGVNPLNRLFHAVHARHQDADSPGGVFAAPFEERNALKSGELLIGNDDIHIIAGEQELTLLRRLGAAEFVICRQQAARQLGECGLIVNEQDRALESTHDESLAARRVR